MTPVVVVTPVVTVTDTVTDTVAGPVLAVIGTFLMAVATRLRPGTPTSEQAAST